MSSTLIDPTLFFQFEVHVPRVLPRATDANWELPAACKVPFLGQLNGREPFAELRLGWNDHGLLIQFDVQGKKKPTQLSALTGGRSDGMRLWLDTRGSPDIHRASRFCHCFSLLPGSSDSSKPIAIATQEQIARAREMPNPISSDKIPIRSEFHKLGYRLCTLLPGKLLTGFAPLEFPEMSFFYSINDAELGVQTLTVGSEMRYYEDPSLWSRLRLETTAKN